MSIQEIRIKNIAGLPEVKGNEILYEIQHSLRVESVTAVRTAQVFRFEGVTEKEAKVLAEELLAEKIFQEYTLNSPIVNNYDYMIEVAYKPGVMNPEAASLMKAARDLDINTLQAADSSTEYFFIGSGITQSEIDLITKRLVVNDTVEQVINEKPQTLVISGSLGETEVIPLRSMTENEMVRLSKDRLFLNLDEMKIIRSYFNDIDRDPTDCELETIAQTWSEHCVHKTFKAKLIVDGQEKEPLMKRLQHATKKANHPLVLSSFVDNSGVMDFYEGYAVCGKVETHNSPSAIEPYGGAMTGSGGVFRDIMGTGQGAKVVSSTDMFCVAEPGLPFSEVPAGCLHPNYLLRRVVAGVKDYGNRMGIPTNNGSVHFHRDFRAKPSIIVGAYGILPADKCTKGEPQAGDLAIAVGGRTGRDGIHGATFSSGEMTHRTISVNSSAVQIGHPIEEKRMSDALLNARDKDLIRAITDCGAGGFSSALGEMGEDIGVEVWLDKMPLKYPGLAPWEIWQSESQERMVVAIDPHNLEQLVEICKEYNVEATVIGKFTGNKRLEVWYDKEIVCNLDMEFLHNGLPQRIMTGSWQPQTLDEPADKQPAHWPATYKNIMATLNVCSKEPIVRLYDHGVQSGSALPPFGGVAFDAPNDATVVTPVLGKNYGLVISHGLNPILNNIDPYYGSLWASAEAVSNAIASGLNPKDICLIDNFVWPFPDEEALGALDMAVDACTDFVQATGMPFISGKDSLSSTYRSQQGEVIKIPPVLCVSAFGRLEDVTKTVSTDFKVDGSQIILVGYRDTSQMGGSTYFELLGAVGNKLPKLDPSKLYQVWQSIYTNIQDNSLLACHDISEGGLAACLAEMCFGGNLGAKINIPAAQRADYFMFNETAGCFLTEIPANIEPGQLFKDIPYIKLGVTDVRPYITITHGDKELLDVSINELKASWQKPMKEVFGG